MFRRKATIRLDELIKSGYSAAVNSAGQQWISSYISDRYDDVTAALDRATEEQLRDLIVVILACSGNGKMKIIKDIRKRLNS